jgi:hypothetical protein
LLVHLADDSMPHKTAGRALAFLAMLGLVLSPVGPASAQLSLRVGDRVRVTTREPALHPAVPNAQTTHSVIGDVVALTGDSLVLSTDGWRLPLARAGLLRVEVSRGRAHRSVRLGAVIGGAVTGGILVSVACGMAGRDCALRNAPQMTALFAIGAIPGALIGATVAEIWTTGERWDEVPTTYLVATLLGIGGS